MIPVFIASSDRFSGCEWMAQFSIRENTQAEVKIHVIRPQDHGLPESGCTGFSHLRYWIPEIGRKMGYQYAIYLDVDMLVLGDISDLYGYRKPGRWVGLSDGATEVAVIDTAINLQKPSGKYRPSIPMSRDIPLLWNVEDKVADGMKLLHFTDLKAQPWFFDHPNAEAVKIYKEYCARHHHRHRA